MNIHYKQHIATLDATENKGSLPVLFTAQ